MNPLPQSRNSITFPHGFLDFLHVSQGRRHTIGDYELEPVRIVANDLLNAIPNLDGLLAQRMVEPVQSASVGGVGRQPERAVRPSRGGLAATG